MVIVMYKIIYFSSYIIIVHCKIDNILCMYNICMNKDKVFEKVLLSEVPFRRFLVWEVYDCKYLLLRIHWYCFSWNP